MFVVYQSENEREIAYLPDEKSENNYSDSDWEIDDGGAFDIFKNSSS